MQPAPGQYPREAFADPKRAFEPRRVQALGLARIEGNRCACGTGEMAEHLGQAATGDVESLHPLLRRHLRCQRCRRPSTRRRCRQQPDRYCAPQTTFFEHPGHAYPPQQSINRNSLRDEPNDAQQKCKCKKIRCCSRCHQAAQQAPCQCTSWPETLAQ
ncbi:hypothetical protein D3C80_1695960 [compost metagenome]